MKKKTIIIGIVVVMLGLLIGGLIMKGQPTEAEVKARKAHQNYESLMVNQKISDPEDLLNDALKNPKQGEAIYLVIYKRTCPVCQKYYKNFRTKVDKYKKDGDIIIVLEAPQKEIIKEYPTWAYNFEIPDIKTPVLIRYDISQISNSLPLRYTNFEHYYGHSKGWITKTEPNHY